MRTIVCVRLCVRACVVVIVVVWGVFTKTCEDLSASLL